jgi:hypothetical protein
MEIIFFLCAIVGGTVMVCQFVMTVLGLGADLDVPDDVGGAEFHAGGDFGGHAHDLASADASVDSASHGGDLTDALDHKHASSHAHHNTSNWIFVKLTFQTVVAAIAFFGLGGMAARSSGIQPWLAVVIAVASGTAALYIVYWLMELLHRFNSEGNVRIDNAVGLQGTVYISIPPENTGAGKIVLNLQNRTVELEAKTNEPSKLAPGANVVVLSILGPGLVEVAPIRETADSATA